MNNQVNKTRHDGWECVHQFAQMARVIEKSEKTRYEIFKCVRTRSTEDIILEMEVLAGYLLEKCEELRRDGIDKADFVTIEEMD
tara:strand:+ start:2332 stop:2583 length:252 start_codon:yes stop_codon:yes gene_type:complete